MKMEQIVSRNVGIYNSDAGELPKRKHNIFRTRQKFEIKNSIDHNEIYVSCHIQTFQSIVRFSNDERLL
jgi:hypothetical protein